MAKKQRRYTLDEIDRMRAAMLSAIGSFTTSFDGGYSGPCGPDFDSLDERLRNYMTGGVSPEEVEKKYPPFFEAGTPTITAKITTDDDAEQSSKAIDFAEGGDGWKPDGR